MAISICFLISFNLCSIPSTDPLPSMIVVSLDDTFTIRALPNKGLNSSGFIFSILLPLVGDTTVPPVRIAMSSRIAVLRSPKSGAFTAHTLIVAFALLTTKIANASCSMSSATISSGRLSACAACNKGNTCAVLVSLPSYKKINGLSNTACIVELSVTKYGDLKPLSNIIPSTTSREVSPDFDSSIATTPSVPTLSKAVAINVPISISLLAEIVATCLI